MACSDYPRLMDHWANGQVFDAVYCYFSADTTYATGLGDAYVQLIVFSALGLALYAYSRQPIVPLVVAIIGGAIVITPMPAAVVGTAVILGVVVTALVLYLLIRRGRHSTL